MLNKILFCGDPHGNFTNIVRAVHQYSPEAIVMLGDYNLKMPLENYLESIINKTKIYWIAGNHDFDNQDYYENLFTSELSNNNLNLKVIEIQGVRIAGLGGIFKGKNWMPGEPSRWTSKQHWLKNKPSNIKKIPLHLEYSIWHHQFEQMKQEIRADILVCHEAPSTHRYGFSAIDELAKAIGAKKLFHGHHHKYYQNHIKNEIEVTGVAIAGVVNLAGEQLIIRKT